MGFRVGLPRQTDDEDGNNKSGVDMEVLPVTESRQQRISTLERDQALEDQCHIQPHTDAFPDCNYIGDAYEDIDPECAEQWRLKDGIDRPYLDSIKRRAKYLPYLDYLAHWMEVSCAPVKWKLIQPCEHNRKQRAERCNVAVVDFCGGAPPTKTDPFTDVAKLKAALDTELPADTKSPPIRVIIVEDLSRDVVELLGSKYDIDPLFWRSHISDYLFHNARDRWAEVPDLECVAQERSFFNLQYLRARYFKTAKSFENAEYESGSYNVLRRLDSDRSRKRLQDLVLDSKGASVTLMRSKASLWLKPWRESEEAHPGGQDPDDGEAIVAIMLVDPTVDEGYALWGGYRPFMNTPSMHAPDLDEPPTHKTLFQDLIYWVRNMSNGEIAAIRKDPRSVAVPYLRLVLSDWRLVLKYMVTVLTKVELEFDKPHWAEGEVAVEEILKKLSPWQRNLPSYQSMIDEAIDRIFQFPPVLHSEIGDKPAITADEPQSARMHTRRPKTGLLSLLHDFRLVQQLMDKNHNRIKTIQTVVTNVTNAAEAKRAGNQNNNVLRLTLLGIFFLPMNFTTSFLSMSPNIGGSTQTIILFFEIGIPLTVLAFLTLDLWRPDGFIRHGFPKAYRYLRDPKSQKDQKKTIADVKPGQTFAWNTWSKQQTMQNRRRK